MANKSVLELAVGTGSWDAGLKKAKQALDNFTQAQGGLQKALNTDSDKMQQFVRMMGQMDSTAKTAKGQLNDYKGTIETLTMQYNRMSAAQKQTIGQDYLQAIDSMKQKYQAVNEELKEMNQSLNGVKMPDTPAAGSGGGLFGGGKLDGMLQVLGGNLMTKAAGALAVLAADMGDMVKQGVEMAKAGEGIRIAFDRLNQPGLLDNLREATHGTVTNLELMKSAVKFNDFKLPVEELGTMLAFAQQKAKDTGQSVDYMVDSIVTGLGRKSLMILDNLGLSATEVKEKMKETGDMTKAVGAIIREQMAKAGDYVETAADRAAQANVNLQNKMEELGRKFAPLEEASNNFWTSMKIGILDIVGGPLTDLLNKLTQAGRMANAYGLMGGNTKVGRMTSNLASASEGNRQSIYQQQQAQFWRYINPREQHIRDIRAWQRGERGEALQGRINAITEKYGSLDATKIQAEVDAAKKMLSDYQAAAKQILQPIEQKIVPTVGDGGSGGGGGGGKSGNLPDISDFDKALGKSLVGSANLKEIKDSLSPYQMMLPEIKKNILDIKDADLGGTLAQIGEKNVVAEIEAVTKSSEQQKMAMTMAAQAVSNFGAALAGIEDPAAKAAGTVMQAIASIALGFGTAAAQASSMGPYGWIAYIAAGLGAMATAISTVHSLTGYAEGGIVKGNSYSGDNLITQGPNGLIGLNAGEVVLNRAQAGNLAQQLQDTDGGRGSYKPSYVSGEQIWVALNRYTQRTGRGELVTWG